MATSLGAPITGRPLIANGFYGSDASAESGNDWILTLPNKMAAIQHQNRVLFQIVQEQANAIAVLSQEVVNAVSLHKAASVEQERAESQSSTPISADRPGDASFSALGMTTASSPSGGSNPAPEAIAPATPASTTIEPVVVTPTAPSPASTEETAKNESKINLLLEMGYASKDIEAALKSLGDSAGKENGVCLEAIINWIQEQEAMKVKGKAISQGGKNAKKKKKKRKSQPAATNEVSTQKQNVEEEDEIERISREAEERAKRERQLERQEREQQERQEREKQEKRQRNLEQQENQIEEKPAARQVSNQGEVQKTQPRTSIQSEKNSENRLVQVEQHITTKKVALPASKKRAQPVNIQSNRLSHFLYPQTETTAKTTNPIFEFLHDPNSIELARKLLRLEAKISGQKQEFAEKNRAKRDVEENLAKIKEKLYGKEESQERSKKKKKEKLKEEDMGLDEALQNRIGRLQRQLIIATEQFHKTPSKDFSLAALEDLKKNTILSKKDYDKEEKGIKQNIAIVDNYELRKKEIPELIAKARMETQSKRVTLLKEIDELQGQLKKLEGVIKVKEKLLQKRRDEITKWKRLDQGSDQAEDSDFDINDSRNGHGLSFLMICAQNNDLETTKLLFEMGANADVKCPSGLTALSYVRYLQHFEMAKLLREHGGTDSLEDTWNEVRAIGGKSMHRVDWETQLRIAERAVIPADTKMSSNDDASESTNDASDDVSGMDRSCFDASLLDPSTCNFRRIALAETGVYQWFLEAEKPQQSNLVRLIEKLRNSESTPVSFHRRFIVGVKREKQFVIYCASLAQKATLRKSGKIAADDFVCFYSPYIQSFVDGVANVGVLLWAVTTESQAPKYKQLIEGAEFRRNKVYDAGDRWPAHLDYVLELGRDMHLLDLMGTSVFSGKAMELLRLDLDENDLERLGKNNFKPKKRMLEHEQHLQNAIFKSSEQESMEHSGLLKDSLPDKSTNISGGAGTGKTVTLIKKLVSEEPSKKIVVISRLPRLVSFVKSTVEEDRDTSNIDFCTYDELLTAMTRAITPSDPGQKRAFASFNHVGFVDSSTIGGASSSITFEESFVRGFLEAGERKKMDSHSIKPVTLWEAFRVIKSSLQCAKTKLPLTREQYSGLPISYGFTSNQRTLVYDLFERYEEWMGSGSFKWDEADRVLYIFRWGPSVFAEEEFVSWVERSFQYGEPDLLDEAEMPLAPFFYHMVCADEAQDFSELDLSLFIRMASNIQSLFLGADPAQSVEVGVRMRAGTVNGVFHAALPPHQKHIKVKDVLQELTLKTNHRTHARNLAIAKAIRQIMARSYGVPSTDENALMEGPIPEGLRLASLSLLAEKKTFMGGNIVFVAPDEIVSHIRASFLHLNIKNDVFGVREAKGLEFPSVAIIGFFSYFEQAGRSKPWENVIRWLFSNTGVTTKVSNERIQGKVLESLADYALVHPEIEDQAMMLYTAVTRCKGRLYLIEADSGLGASANTNGKAKKGKKGPGLAEFALRQFKDLRLLKLVNSIDEGEVDMSPQQHKARGVLLVVQAVNMGRNDGNLESVRRKFGEAAERFLPDKGNDQHLFDQCQKHRDAFTNKHRIRDLAKTCFFQNGEYNLQGRFVEILQFEKSVAQFLKMCANDCFLVDEIQEVRILCEEIFYGTPFEAHFSGICERMKRIEA